MSAKIWQQINWGTDPSLLRWCKIQQHEKSREGLALHHCDAKIEHVKDPTNAEIATTEKSEHKVNVANPAVILKPFRYQLQYIRSIWSIKNL